jgi:hypothetical protein
MEKDTLIRTKIKHIGIFDFKEIYRLLFDWIVDMGYDMNEKTYKEVIGAGGARELEVEWDAVRKVSDYFRNQLEVRWHIIGMTSVEVEIDGVKQKMNKGQLELEVKCSLMKDYENKWEKKPLFKFIRTFYDKYLIKERTDIFEGKLIGEMEEFVGQAKSFLALTGTK